MGSVLTAQATLWYSCCTAIVRQLKGAAVSADDRPGESVASPTLGRLFVLGTLSLALEISGALSAAT
jgi:hypothetical protein